MAQLPWGTADEMITYARAAYGGRWASAEQLILKRHPWYICRYARFVIKGRWSEAEDFIIKGNQLQEEYAREVLPGHWDEEVAAKCPCWLYFYAKDVVGGKLPVELHNLMLTFGVTHPNDPWLKTYCEAEKYKKVRKARKLVMPANQLEACGAPNAPVPNPSVP
jgi:hypothetical protein